MEHRVWVCALLIQSLLPACSISSLAWLRAISLWHGRAGASGGEHVSVVMGAGVASGVLHLPTTLLSAIAIVYSAVLLYLVARLLWRAWTLSVLLRASTEVRLTGEAALCWARCCKRFGVNNATLAASPKLFGPVTLGLRRGLVLLPTRMLTGLPNEDLDTVIAHEFAHMHRRDFLKNLLYELLALPVSYHPLLWLTRERVIESREILCDQMAAEVAGRKEYARSLLRLASLLVKGTSARAPHAIGIFDANAFERRLMKLTETQRQIHGVRRAATLAACVAFGVTTCGSALALRINVDAAGAGKFGNAASAASAASAPVRVPAGVMARNVLTKVMPKYPPAAKEAKIQGAVVLHAIVSKEGVVENLTVLSGPSELQGSALDSVRQWTYKPYLLNGEAVDVETTVTVTYSIQP